MKGGRGRTSLMRRFTNNSRFIDTLALFLVFVTFHNPFLTLLISSAFIISTSSFTINSSKLLQNALQFIAAYLLEMKIDHLIVEPIKILSLSLISSSVFNANANTKFLNAAILSIAYAFLNRILNVPLTSITKDRILYYLSFHITWTQFLSQFYTPSHTNKYIKRPSIFKPNMHIVHSSTISTDNTHQLKLSLAGIPNAKDTTTALSHTHKNLENFISNNCLSSMKTPFWSFLINWKMSSPDEVYDDMTHIDTIPVYIHHILPDSITFHIQNLLTGQLLVLVNGVLWNETVCALILEREGEEYAIVSALSPGTYYNIQFINRLDSNNNYRIADFTIRTLVEENQKDEHLPLLSPMETLQSSIKTTNDNITLQRLNLKKLKKDIGKKMALLKHEINHTTSKITQVNNNDDKNITKLESLKISTLQNESILESLQDELNSLTEIETNIRKDFMQQEKLYKQHCQDLAALRQTSDAIIDEKTKDLEKLSTETNQLVSKLDRLRKKNSKLSQEVNHKKHEIDSIQIQFVSQRETDRAARQDYRARKLNELELAVKALQQDISRLQKENKNLTAIA